MSVASMPALRRVAPLLLALLTGCISGGLDDDELRQLEVDWELYQVGDPSWPTVRDRWYERGGAARELLVDLLIKDMLVASMDRQWRRPQHELMSLGAETTVDRLVDTMRSLREPASLEAVSTTLAGFGAVDQIMTALESPRVGDTDAFRLFALPALVQSGGSRSIDYVGGQLAGSSDWEIRARAADALGEARISDKPRASAALRAGLTDSDPFVVQRAIEALAELEDRSSAPAIADVLERSDAPRTREAAVRALRRLTRVSVPGNDPARWKIEALRAAGR